MAGLGTRIEGAGFNVGSTWNTAVALGTDDGIKLSSEDIRGGEDALDIDDLGDEVMEPPELGNVNWSGPIRFPLRYGGNCARLLAFAFGGDDNVTANTGTSTHKVQLSTALDKFFTFCRGVDSTEKWWEWASAKIEELEIRWENGGRLEAVATLLASSLDRDSGTNTRTETNAVTVPAGIKQVMGTDAAASSGFLINTASGGALSGSDTIGKVIGGRIRIRRPLQRNHTVESGTSIADPDESGPIMVEVELTFARYPGDALIDEWEAKTEKKARLKFSSGITPGDTEASLMFEFPRLRLAERPQAPVPGQGTIPFTVKYRASTPSAAPTGMDSLATTAILLISEDNRLTDYFA